MIVCWVQDFLPELARDLGATPKPKKWASANYDHVWALTFERERVVLRNIAQRLLPGDADK